MKNSMKTAGVAQSGEEAGVWRLLDASANRAAEALRVVEDVVRFVLNDAQLTQLAKDLRHDLATLLAHNGLASRVFVRDVAGDVGVDIVAAAALPRGSVDGVLAANAARAAQALRSLQECVPLVALATGAEFENLRYRLYAMERAARGVWRAQEYFHEIRLCVLVDGQATLAAFDHLIESLLAANVRMIQIRDKHLSVPAIVQRTQHALAIAQRHDPSGGVIVVVNNYADVAAATGAAGVHVGSDDLPAQLVRRVIGPRCLLGRTVHSMAEAQTAVRDGADYLGVGPCFPSPTKSFATFATPELLKAISRENGLPQFAIGGITLDHLDALAECGYSRVAVASAVTRAANPGKAAAAIIQRLNRLGSVPEPSTSS
jgi:thiamine-phosphate pyrophosphorylase